jgi:hypothetical protein
VSEPIVKPPDAIERERQVAAHLRICYVAEQKRLKRSRS